MLCIRRFVGKSSNVQARRHDDTIYNSHLPVPSMTRAAKANRVQNKAASEK